MPRHAETRAMPYSPEQMFDLVADVPSYGQFLPWVSGVRVKSNSDTEMVADLMVGFKSIREKFTSRVSKERPLKIHVDYIDGPLKFLHNHWLFQPDGQGGSLVEFSVDFEFRSRIFEAIAGQMFGKALRKMISAFESRAAELYAPSETSGIKSSRAHNAA